jgi:hypothetical protein
MERRAARAASTEVVPSCRGWGSGRREGAAGPVGPPSPAKQASGAPARPNTVRAKSTRTRSQAGFLMTHTHESNRSHGDPLSVRRSGRRTTGPAIIILPHMPDVCWDREPWGAFICLSDLARPLTNTPPSLRQRFKLQAERLFLTIRQLASAVVQFSVPGEFEDRDLLQPKCRKRTSFQKQ